NGQIGEIRLPINSRIAPRATTNIRLAGNLQPTLAGTPTSFTRNIEVVDSLGHCHLVEIVFEETTDPNEWSWEARDSSGVIDGATGSITFNDQGQIIAGQTGNIPNFDPPGDAALMNITIDFSQLTQYAANESSIAYEQNGYEMGYLDSFKIDSA